MESKCHNEGTCEPKNTTIYPCYDTHRAHNFDDYYECECPLGYSGTYCETRDSFCLSSPCPEPFVCYDYPGYYECGCPSTDFHCGMQPWMVALIILGIIAAIIVALVITYKRKYQGTVQYVRQKGSKEVTGWKEKFEAMQGPALPEEEEIPEPESEPEPEPEGPMDFNFDKEDLNVIPSNRPMLNYVDPSDKSRKMISINHPKLGIIQMVQPSQSSMDFRHPTPGPQSHSSLDYRHPSPAPMTPVGKGSKGPNFSKVHPEGENSSRYGTPLSTAKVHPEMPKDSGSESPASRSSTPSFRASQNNGQVNQAFNNNEPRSISAALSISELPDHNDISHA